ncbi:MAG: nicotinamide-nucleotide adenylyltransferase [Salinirussus sp.]
MATTRGLLVGRFQPFHNGHRGLVEQIADAVDEVVIGVGSADASHTVRNPFTGGERIVMITNVLESFDVTSYVVPIEDLDRNAVWVSHAESMCPPFHVVFSNNPLVVRLFTEAGYEVRDTDLADRERLKGSEIRREIIDGNAWRDRVPNAVAAAIDEIDGVDRLRTVARTDTE